jgi:hypothetical protein
VRADVRVDALVRSKRPVQRAGHAEVGTGVSSEVSTEVGSGASAEVSTEAGTAHQYGARRRTMEKTGAGGGP